MKIKIINGPNINMLGIREPDIYGTETYSDLVKKIKSHADKTDVKTEIFQSNSEGDLIDEIQKCYGRFDGIIINPAAYTHTSIALYDALKAVGLPAVEVHISDPDKREDFRKINFIRPACIATVKGKGTDGYLEAIDILKQLRSKKEYSVYIEKSRASGTVWVPASKSAAHRMLICAALSDGVTFIENLPDCDDVSATIDCLNSFASCVRKVGATAVVSGIDFGNIESDVLYFDCRESATTLRLILPIALLTGKKCVFKGSGKLLSRPLSVYENICKEKGFLFEKSSTEITVCGKLTSGIYNIDGSVSSQFVSGFLLALTKCNGDSKISLTKDLVSKPYADLTLQIMSLFSFSAKKEPNGKCFKVFGNQNGKALNSVTVPEDFSAAAVFSAFELFGGNVILSGLENSSLQADKIFSKHFDTVKRENGVIDVTDCPDLAPLLAVLGAIMNGVTLTGTNRLKHKESDRINAIKTELQKCGVEVSLFENGITVPNADVLKENCRFSSHNDHRIAMALAVLASVTGGTVENAEAVSKSLPEFWDILENINIRITKI